MKKLSLFFLYIVFSQAANSQQWKIMGDSTVSDYAGDNTYITVDNNGIPYVVYRDNSIVVGATVKKYENGKWILVGSQAFSNGDAHGINIEFDNSNIPYVSYTDENEKATVMKFDGTSWIPLGVKGFSPANAEYLSLAIDKNNTPYVAFADQFNGGRASVMKFNGTNWVYVGKPGFSPDQGLYTSLSIDNNGTPFIEFMDAYDIIDKATVMKFDGNNWVIVGQPRFAFVNVNGGKALAFDSNNVPHLVCSTGNSARVLKFDGTNWVPVGGGISPGGTDYAFIAINKYDAVYVSYTDLTNGRKATVRKFDGINWLDVGDPSFTPTECYYLSLALGNNGKIYSAFEDGTPHNFFDNGNYITYYPATAMMFQEKGLGVMESKRNSLFDIFPNPAQGKFTVKADGNSTYILQVRNVRGEILYSANCKAEKTEIDMSNQAKGVYFIEAVIGQNRETKKIILQ